MDEATPQNQNVRAPLRRPVRPIPEQKEEVNYRIKMWMGLLMVALAISVDLAELAITWTGVVVIGGILSSLLSIVVSFIFWLWLLLLGVSSFTNPKRFAVLLITCLGEIIPFLDAVPILSWLWTFGIIATVYLTRKEDEGGAVGALAGATMTLLERRYTNYKEILNDPQKIAETKKKYGKNIFAISKNELIAEATGINKEYSAKTSYGREVNIADSTNYSGLDNVKPFKKNQQKSGSRPNQNTLNLKTSVSNTTDKNNTVDYDHFKRYAQRHEDYRRSDMLNKMK